MLWAIARWFWWHFHKSFCSPQSISLSNSVIGLQNLKWVRNTTLFFSLWCHGVCVSEYLLKLMNLLTCILSDDASNMKKRDLKFKYALCYLSFTTRISIIFLHLSVSCLSYYWIVIFFRKRRISSGRLLYNYLGRSLNFIYYVTLFSHYVTHYIDRRVRFNLVRLADRCWTIK